MKYYIVDTTLSNTPKVYTSLQEVIHHLEGTVQRQFKLTRAQYMQNLIELGHGYDDDGGITFAQSMAESFNMGIIKQGNYVRTNIHEATNHNTYRQQYGD